MGSNKVARTKSQFKRQRSADIERKWRGRPHLFASLGKSGVAHSGSSVAEAPCRFDGRRTRQSVRLAGLRTVRGRSNNGIDATADAGDNRRHGPRHLGRLAIAEAAFERAKQIGDAGMRHESDASALYKI